MLIGIFYSQIVESSSLVSVLFREAISHPYISFFHLLVNGFSVIYTQLHINMILYYIKYACIIILLDTVPGIIDIGDNDSDKASQKATPTYSVSSPPEHATSVLTGSKRRQVEKGNRRTCFSILPIILLVKFYVLLCVF